MHFSAKSPGANQLSRGFDSKSHSLINVFAFEEHLAARNPQVKKCSLHLAISPLSKCFVSLIEWVTRFVKLSPQHYREPPVNSQGPSELRLLIGWENVSGFERKGV